MSNTYKLLDCGNFNKLEQVGPYLFVRPSPGAVWPPLLPKNQWDKADATFTRKSDGKGFWTLKNNNIPESWITNFDGIKLNVKKTNFGHLGFFAEQSKNWSYFQKIIKPEVPQRSTYQVLNLFAYTGAASISCALSGAQVTHLDASKTSNVWAKQNAELNNLSESSVRWLTDDVNRFIEREKRRGNKYQAIILDPPSFGRGAKGQVWKIEAHMIPLLNNLQALMSDDFHFISLSSHSAGYTPLSLKNLLSHICHKKTGTYEEREMTIPFNDQHLPSGATCIFKT